jgi:multidrug efflux pump subunit AcrA (membrane-fusion protein)
MLLSTAPRVAPVPSDEIDWPRTFASIVVYGGMLLILGLLVLALVLVVRWLHQKSEQQSLALQAQRVQQAAAWAAHEEQRRAAMMAQYGAVEAARRWEQEERERREQQVAQARLDDLTRRFGSSAAHRILQGEVWRGQSVAALLEALGPPADSDQKVMKTKTKTVYKWGHVSGNRYAVRVTVENGFVIGWER